MMEVRLRRLYCPLSYEHRDKIAGQSKAPSVPVQLHMAVMGALGGIKDVTPAAIIKEVLKA